MINKRSNNKCSWLMLLIGTFRDFRKLPSHFDPEIRVETCQISTPTNPTKKNDVNSSFKNHKKNIWAMYYRSLTEFKPISGPGFPYNHHLGWPLRVGRLFVNSAQLHRLSLHCQNPSIHLAGGGQPKLGGVPKVGRWKQKQPWHIERFFCFSKMIGSGRCTVSYMYISIQNMVCHFGFGYLDVKFSEGYECAPFKTISVEVGPWKPLKWQRETRQTFSSLGAKGLIFTPNS